MMMMVMMMNCFCGMVDRRKAFGLISSRDHCQRSSPSRISDTPRAGFEPAQNLSSGLVEWSCALVITTTPRRHQDQSLIFSKPVILSKINRKSTKKSMNKKFHLQYYTAYDFYIMLDIRWVYWICFTAVGKTLAMMLSFICFFCNLFDFLMNRKLTLAKLYFTIVFFTKKRRDVRCSGSSFYKFNFTQFHLVFILSIFMALFYFSCISLDFFYAEVKLLCETMR